VNQLKKACLTYFPSIGPQIWLCTFDRQSVGLSNLNDLVVFCSFVHVGLQKIFLFYFNVLNWQSSYV
jgi:hypothetical protein